MREILFRGKSLKDNEWTEGYYCRYGWTGKEKDYIIPDYASALYGVEVDSNTIGQFTGLIDSNGRKIFEGDVIQDGNCDYNKYVVEYSTTRAGYFPFAHGDGCGCCERNVLYDSTCHTIIGNIYDNPELVKDAIQEE